MTLALSRKENEWLVFNQHAMREEVVAFFWGDRFNPTIDELYQRTPAGVVDIGDTHWQFARTAFASRPQLYSRMLPAARRQMDSLATPEPVVERLSWVSRRAWEQFQAAGDGLHRYRDSSSDGTDVILIKRNGALWGGYAEGQTDLDTIRARLHVVDEPLWRSILFGESVESARARWIASTNRDYNTFMKKTVSTRVGPREARTRFERMVRSQFAAAFLPLIGGSVAAHPAGAALRAITR